MKAPASGGKKTSKAKTSTPKGRKSGAKRHYTAAQNASFRTWLNKVRAKDHADHLRHVAHVNHMNHIHRTLSLHHRNNVSKGSDVKLGRNAPAADKPRLTLDKYLTGAVAPAVVDFASEVLTWPMYGNDTIGDCTAACVGHEIQAWTRYTGAEVDVPQDEIVQLYSAVSGYDPATGANDNGASVQDVLTYWRKSGVPVAGHQILAFAELKDFTRIKDALWMFGSVYLGINFPRSAMDQFDSCMPWSVAGDGTIVGGHAVPLQYAGAAPWPYQVVTWGRLQGMSQAFLDTYCEEAWVVITADWLDKNGHTPEGLDLAQLGADLSQLTGDPNPFPAPAPQPEPAPSPAPAPAPQPDPSVLQDIEHAAEAIIADVEKIL